MKSNLLCRNILMLQVQAILTLLKTLPIFSPSSSYCVAPSVSFLVTESRWTRDFDPSYLGSSKIISSAVTHLPWLDENGKPLSDVSAYAAQMTYVNIMFVLLTFLPRTHSPSSRNYDVFSASSNPGPNAPLGEFLNPPSTPPVH